MFKQAATVDVPDTWQEYAEEIHQPTIELFSQFLAPLEEGDILQ